MTRTFNTKLVIRVLGALLLLEALFMLVPTAAAWWYKEPDLLAFAISVGITFIVGVIWMLTGRKAERRMGEREGYVIVALVWIVFSFFGLLPFYLSGAVSSFTDAFFETMSGFTTTGASIIPDVEVMTHSILLWRAMTHWLGGMGIIVLSIAILPMLGLGGMQLYTAEATGITYEKLSPRISDTARILWAVYVLLTVLQTLLLYVFDMGLFDAICHSFSTIATGGFSTKNASLSGYSPAIQYIVAIFMFLSGLNFSLLVFALRGKPEKLIRDEETQWYLSAAAVGTAIITIGLFVTGTAWNLHTAEESFRMAFFTVVSAMTSTGFANDNYTPWLPFLWSIIFFLMLTGACAGSTAGGIKWVRIVVSIKHVAAELKRKIHPNAVISVKLNDKPISQQTTNNVLAFIIFYFLTIVAAVLIFSACGIQFDEAMGTAVSSIGNIGLCIGDFGPENGTFAAYPIIAKWTICALMLIGRLEIFTVLLLFSPALWRK